MGGKDVGRAGSKTFRLSCRGRFRQRSEKVDRFMMPRTSSHGEEVPWITLKEQFLDSFLLPAMDHA